MNSQQEVALRIDDEQTEIVYSANSQMRSPIRLLSEVVRGMRIGLPLGWRLFIRDISARFRQSRLGMVWLFIPPVVTGLVFVILQARRVLAIDSGAIPYPVFAMIGATLWSVFAESVLAPLKAINENRAMIAKIRFPWEALLLSGFFDMLFNTGAKLLVLVAILFYFDVSPAASWFALAIWIPGILVLGFCIGLLISPVGVAFKDVEAGVTAFMPFWFLITPAVYPRADSGLLNYVHAFNPIAPLITASREALVGIPYTSATMGILVMVASLGVLVCGLIAYRATLPILIERMSS